MTVSDETKSYYHKKYGVWAGNPRGTAPDYTRCSENVADAGRSFLFHQCRLKNGHGPSGAYCKQHGRKAEKRLALYARFGDSA